MKTTLNIICLSAMLACTMSMQAPAAVITNGGFEPNLAGWTAVNQPGSEGQFFSQTGILSPVNFFGVPAPPEGSNAAMTDAGGPGSHVLYQDFVVPTVTTSATIGFSLFINNSAAAFFTPASLAFATPTLNQQARVDIITTTADPFSVAAADVLQNLYQTNVGDPLTSGYNPFLIDITALLQAQQGQTLRLRFAEVDNVNAFNLGVDAVSINADVVVEPIPEPSSWIMVTGALLGLGFVRRSKV
jgi:hypothetical protein